ncbi:MAG TPA: nickel/cobalt transporter [Xanthobacteraceae bacterium]|nr:nickel/cobalt transporter [Xanthobacteraceae bacterium]
MKAASDLLYRSACVCLRRFGALAAAGLLSLLVASALTEAYAQVSPLVAMRQPPATGIVGWVLAEQAMFYRALSGLIRAAKTDGSAYWSLIGISFIYGIFHAAGPGHGKAVISSYLVANEETWRRGIALSFASALLQAVTAIVIVSVAAGLIGATAKMMGDTVRVIEIVSYSLIVLLGARLLWVKGRGFFRALRAVHQEHAGHAHHDHHEHSHRHAHDHGHDHDEEDGVLPWGHAHGPEPEELAGPGGWRRGFSAIVAVGLRPCSGAIIVLVFALAQGLYWAGVASTFVMGLGTAITVATIATIAVGARTAAKRVASTRAGYGTLILRGIEVGAAVVVMAFGVLLLTGYMASERMGMF